MAPATSLFPLPPGILEGGQVTGAEVKVMGAPGLDTQHPGILTSLLVLYLCNL